MTSRQTLHAIYALAAGVVMAIGMGIWNRMEIAAAICRIAPMETKATNPAADTADLGCEGHIALHRKLVREARVRREQ